MFRCWFIGWADSWSDNVLIFGKFSGSRHQFPLQQINMATKFAKWTPWCGWRIGLTIFILLTLLSTQASPVHAARGAPGSAEFGFGAHIDLWGTEIELAINAAVGIGLDWLAIDFDWSRHWAEEGDSSLLDRLDQALAQISQHEVKALLSITNPPAWAITPSGPDTDKVIQLLRLLVERYGEVISAFELFPNANTVKGWGATPNPQAYAHLLQRVHQALADTHSQAFIVGAGLKPLTHLSDSTDIDDLTYLSGLYQAGAANYMPVVSLRLENISSVSITLSGEINTSGLRHYEEVRRLMNENAHSNGLIWVTAYKMPELQHDDPSTMHPTQIRWLNQAVLMMKSQLYIGVAFYDNLNPAQGITSTGPSDSSLIHTQAGQVYLHPALSALGHIITTIHTGHNNAFQLSLYKKISSTTPKNLMKGNKP